MDSQDTMSNYFKDLSAQDKLTYTNTGPLRDHCSLHYTEVAILSDNLENQGNS